MTDRQQKMHDFANLVSQNAISSGLSWDEAVMALGIASKAIAQIAAQGGDQHPDSCEPLARKRLDQGFAQQVQVVMGATSPSQLH